MLFLSEEYKEWFVYGIQNVVWNDVKFVQDFSDYYSLLKWIGKDYVWVGMLYGSWVKGFCYVGGENGGIVFGLWYFFEKYLLVLEIIGFVGSYLKMIVWFWFLDGEVMDLWYYIGNIYVVSVYEGFDEMCVDLIGIVNINEISLLCFLYMLFDDVFYMFVDKWQVLLLFVCELDVYYELKVFGVWSVIDIFYLFKKELEEQFDVVFLFYKKEVEQCRWYGFWYYGDVMYMYDLIWYMWWYDFGGYVW